MPGIAGESSGRNRAVGPGAKTRDGCSVDLYLRLPYRGEVDLLRPRLPTGASILELGCGVGRITRELLLQGYRVTAVDNSPEMLAHVPTKAAPVCADIENLELGVTFDAVVLTSCLINIPNEALRATQLTKCREHLKSGGNLFFERYDPVWLSNVSAGYIGRIGTIDMYVKEVLRDGAKVDMCCRYEEQGESWLHSFGTYVLDDAAVQRCLSNAGFAEPCWIDERHRWGASMASENLPLSLRKHIPSS